MQLIVNKVSKQFNDHPILDQVTFALGDREIAGLIGANGSGKTTLLKIITGQTMSDSGSVKLTPAGGTIGYVSQAPDIPNGVSVGDFIAESVNLPGEENYKVDLALAELTISELRDKNIDELSSGQKSKVFLARILVDKPDLLLLDEPTNHLDLESLGWLEHYLSGYSGSSLMVSHDRRFLDNLVTKVFELVDGQVKIFGGNYSFYKQQKLIESESKRRAYIVQEKKITRIESRVATVQRGVQDLEARTTGTDHYFRRKAAKGAHVALSMIKRLEKEVSESNLDKPSPDLNLAAIFRPRRESSETVVFLNQINKNYPDKTIFNNLSLHIKRGDRLVLTGPNGSGKSTLIKIIMQEVLPDSGEVEIGSHVDIGYLPQEVSHTDLGQEMTLLEYLINQLQLERTNSYRLAHRFLFSEDNLRTPVKSLSSGQKSRLKLASIMASGANFIILDEPTNHLDIPSREALETAIASYSGTILVVSHDRYFLDMINPDKVINL